MNPGLKYNNKRNFIWVDYIKGVACLFIVFVHFNNRFSAPAFSNIFAAGGRGVDVFFIISGFLTMISLNNKKDGETLIAWYRKRIVRLAPLYYIAIILSLIVFRSSGGGVEYWLGSQKKVTITNILAHFMFLHGLNPYYADSIIGVEWYIGILVLLYAVSPLIHKYITSLKRAIIFFFISYISSKVFVKVLLALIVGNAEIPDLYLWEHYIRSFSLFAMLPVYAIGILFFYLNQNHNVREFFENKIFRNVALVGSVIIFLFACNILLINRSEIWWLGFVLIFLSLNSAKALIGQKIFTVIGKYSYGIYLFHYSIVSKWNMYDVRYSIISWVFGLSVVVISAFLLSIFFTYLEKGIVMNFKCR